MIGLLGKHPPKHDRRTISAGAVLVRSAVPAAPPARAWGDALTSIDMLGNDEAGDCTLASLLHVIELVCAELGIPIPPFTAQQALTFYSEVTGYDGTPGTDNGAPMLDVLNWARKKGLIAGFVKVDHQDVELVELAFNTLGPLYVGGSLPKTAQDTSKTWTVPSMLAGDAAPNSWGGHAMALCRVDRLGPTFATWAIRQRANWQWHHDYIDEAYGLILPQWVDDTHPAPNGLDLTAFNAAIAAIGAAL